MKDRISAATRVFALLGDPVDHSLSPGIQNGAFREAGVDGVYVALRCDAEDLAGLMRALARAGGGGNVTLPHKEEAAAVVDSLSDAVRRTGACNTFWGEDGEVRGDNTDVEGFRRALRAFLGEEPEGARVLLLGAGGAARATLVGLLDGGVEEVVLLNRTVERARAVARRIGGKRAHVAESVEEVEGEPFHLVVNATRLGLSPDDPLPVDLELLGPVRAVMDLVYGDGGTRFVRVARERGIQATDGAEMLVRQGAVSFERWWGRPPPLDAMRSELGRRAPAR
ncbi:MAG: shikimate dehydrogenase [Gemmatimonadetes bacterium]|nr:shikimate dehydrogenase [Gemmatimonadota bacterium]NIR79235.1 shikimate dehydrogenase [Gemmatimonadota bacterium]NIT87897.1 shikimate dehydrogenase [Gemmatimonadota bacterium]NIU31751.1 shikimate dehydrogenase [Gemmatimonadota bacterium]NIU36368.1 shikimate dehydrogenase [Gemmatimonadota bacterium]